MNNTTSSIFSMVGLKTPPENGWAGYGRNNENYNRYEVKFRDSYRPNDALGVFGFHSGDTVPSEAVRTWDVDVERGSVEEEVRSAKRKALALVSDRVGAIFHNLFIVLGYIPVIGIIICMIRWHCSKEDPESAKTAHKVRGVFEALGLGVLCLLPDIGVTIHRFYKQVQYNRALEREYRVEVLRV